mgnify:FL=1
MLLKLEEIYSRFNNENIQIKVPKKITIHFVAADGQAP